MYLTNLHAGWESLYEGSISHLGIHKYTLILTTCFACHVRGFRTSQGALVVKMDSDSGREVQDETRFNCLGQHRSGYLYIIYDTRAQYKRRPKHVIYEHTKESVTSENRQSSHCALLLTLTTSSE